MGRAVPLALALLQPFQVADLHSRRQRKPADSYTLMLVTQVIAYVLGNLWSQKFNS